MKVALGLPTYNVDLAHEFGSAPAIAAVARAAEAAGFDACFSDDHPIPGEDAFAFGMDDHRVEVDLANAGIAGHDPAHLHDQRGERGDVERG